jgi:hypothetical protein
MSGEVIIYASKQMECKAGLTRVAHRILNSTLLITSKGDIQDTSIIKATVKDQFEVEPFRCNDCPLFEEHACGSQNRE